MFFLYIFLFIILILLFFKIELEAVKKEDTYIEIKIFKIRVFRKYFKEKHPKESKILKIPDILAINKKRFLLKKAVKFFKITMKKINVKKCNLKITISDKDYIKGAYLFSFLYTVLYIAKNYIKGLNFNCLYAGQSENIKIKYHVQINARIINIVIALIKLLIIYYRMFKKGMNKNGRKSNREFNDDSNVIYRKYD